MPKALTPKTFRGKNTFSYGFFKVTKANNEITAKEIPVVKNTNEEDHTFLKAGAKVESAFVLLSCIWFIGWLLYRNDIIIKL